MEVSDAAVNASYSIDEKLAVASKAYSDWEFVKNCLLKATEIVSQKHQSFANISLTRNTICYRISDLATDIDGQPKEKVESFVKFS